MLTEYNCDVVVIGAGLAGVCAALAAARHEKKVVLVGDRPVLGGNSSSEIRVWTRGAVGAGNLYSEEMGILGELKLRNQQVNPDGNVLYWGETLFEAIYCQPSITLLLNTYINKVTLDGDKIINVSGFQLTTEREILIKSAYYIDSTGDGSVGAKANVPFRMGYESRDEYHESSAPVTPGKRVLGSTIFFYTKKEDHPVPFIPPAYAHSISYIQQFLDRGGRIVDEKQSGSDYWWFEYGGLRNTIAEAEDITLELRKLVMGIWNYIKNSGKFDADHLTLEWIGNIAGKRGSRRMVADYVMTQNDVQTASQFHDSAFYGGWYMDDHPAEGIYSKDQNAVQIPVQTYSIPLRSLFSGKCKNLLFAGRIIGATHTAHTSMRVMNTCALSGQAAGTLAAVCLNTSLSPAEQAAKPEAVQQNLLREGLMIPGLVNKDENDLAKQAHISVSSFMAILENEHDGRMLSLTEPTFLQLAVPAGISKMQIDIKTENDTTLRGAAFTAPLPSRLCPGDQLCEIACAAMPGKPLTIELPPENRNRFVTIIFEPNEQVSILSAKMAPLGFLMGHQWSMDHMYPMVKSVLGSLYAGENMTKGYHYPIGEPNLWISGVEPEPSLTLKWQKKKTIRQIELYLEPDLAREKPSSFTSYWSNSHMLSRPIPGRPWQLNSSVILWLPKGQSWFKAAEVYDNWKHHLTIQLTQSVQTDAVRISFPSPEPENGMFKAQVFQVRAY